MARPRKKIDPEEVRKLAERGAPVKSIAILLGVDRVTIYNRCKDALQLGQEQRKQKIRDLQMAAAEKHNPALLIFLGKNELGQSDKQEIETSQKGPLVIVRRGKDEKSKPE